MTLIELFKKHKRNCENFIETGTYNGAGVQAALNAGFKKIASFEVDRELALKALDKFKKDKGVLIENRSSTHPRFKMLAGHLNNIGPVFFWLDAHKMGPNGVVPDDYPLSAELEAIRELPRDNVILVDDVRLFYRYNVDISKVVADYEGTHHITMETIRESYPDDVLCITPKKGSK